MITVNVKKNEAGFVSGFTISGHADGYKDDQEYDLICASVSAITLTCALGLQDLLKENGKFESHKGWLCVELTGDPDRETDLLISTMLLGLQQIKKQYPDKIRFVSQKG
jgi:uncharacterized protein YsxB (DUF464 family)